MSDLGTAIAIAAEAFEKVTDRGGQPYIMHCLRVMNALPEDDEELRIIGVLHDLIEDTGWEFKQLYQLGFSDRVVRALMLLTHDKSIDPDYKEYIKKIATNPDAVAVKLKDLRDNSDVTRLKGVTAKDLARIQKYHESYNYLKKI
jgi:guanosine-3',5'-bis(diphosphate) 3'-pyrophosphohydrolase